MRRQLRGAAALGGAKVGRLLGLSALVLVAFGLFTMTDKNNKLAMLFRS